MGVIPDSNLEFISVVFLVQHRILLYKASPSPLPLYDPGINRGSSLFHIVLQNMGGLADWGPRISRVNFKNHKRPVSRNQNEVC
jgi:hypothetical protein